MPRRSGGSFALNSGGSVNVNGAGILLYFVILGKGRRGDRSRRT
jgi:hypothetical protein